MLKRPSPRPADRTQHTTRFVLREDDCIGRAEFKLNAFYEQAAAALVKEVTYDLAQSRNNKVHSKVVVVLKGERELAARDNHQTVRFRVGCRGLDKVQLFSQSDPVVVVYNKPAGTPEQAHADNWQLVGQTERQKDNRHPDFEREFRLPCDPAADTLLRLLVYQCGDKGSLDHTTGETQYKLDEKHRLGVCELSLHAFLEATQRDGAAKWTDTPLLDGEGAPCKGSLLRLTLAGVDELSVDPSNATRAAAEEAAAAASRDDGPLVKSDVSVEVSCRGLPRGDWLSKSDPLAALYCRDSAGRFQLQGCTERLRNTHNPTFTTQLTLVHDESADTDVKLVIYDAGSSRRGKDGRHIYKVEQEADALGSVVLSIHELCERALTNPQRCARYELSKAGTTSGKGTVMLRITDVTAHKEAHNTLSPAGAETKRTGASGDSAKTAALRQRRRRAREHHRFAKTVPASKVRFFFFLTSVPHLTILARAITLTLATSTAQLDAAARDEFFKMLSNTGLSKPKDKWASRDDAANCVFQPQISKVGYASGDTPKL